MRSVVRRTLIVLGCIAVALVLTAAAHRVFVGSPRTRRYVVRDEPVAVPSDSVSIARGEHLVAAVAVCTICHGDDLGGKLAFEDRFLGLGYTPNLTPGRGGIGAAYTDADWSRAIRHGVDRHGRGLLFMPVDHYYQLDDTDLGAIIAYLKTLKPRDNEQTSLRISLPARLLIDVGAFGQMVPAARIDHLAQRPARIADEGAYLIAVAGCTFCHGATLTGGQGPEPSAPPGPDLTASGRLREWSFAQFATTMRTGTTPDGHGITPKYMPWLGYRHMTDDELRAIWGTLLRLPPRKSEH